MSPAYWLMKSEPQTFSIDDLAKLPSKKTLWDGVRNYQVRNTLRNTIRVGDLAFFYHSSCPIPGIAGIMTVTRTGIIDPTAFDDTSAYFDPKSDIQKPRWYAVEIQLLEKFVNLLPLNTMRKTAGLEKFTLLRRGNRLSVFSVSTQEWHILNNLVERK